MSKIAGLEHKKSLAVLGYPRCGQHGVSHWLFCQFPGLGLFLNNYGPSAHLKVWYANGEQHVKRPLADPINLLGVGLEGRIDTPTCPNLPRVIVVRDIKNHFASILKHGNIGHSKLFAVWKDYILHALGHKTFGDQSVTVNFPKWHIDLDYRRTIFEEVCAMLGASVPFTDAGREYIMGSGGGSSFDKLDFRTNPSKMKILDRYKAPEVRERIKSIPSDILSLNEQYFGAYND